MSFPYANTHTEPERGRNVNSDQAQDGLGTSAHARALFWGAILAGAAVPQLGKLKEEILAAMAASVVAGKAVGLSDPDRLAGLSPKPRVD
jgi:hypothetical protein